MGRPPALMNFANWYGYGDPGLSSRRRCHQMRYTMSNRTPIQSIDRKVFPLNGRILDLFIPIRERRRDVWKTINRVESNGGGDVSVSIWTSWPIRFLCLSQTGTVPLTSRSASRRPCVKYTIKGKNMRYTDRMPRRRLNTIVLRDDSTPRNGNGQQMVERGALESCGSPNMPKWIKPNSLLGKKLFNDKLA